MGKPPVSQSNQKKMKIASLATMKFDMNAVTQALNDMRRTCGGGDIPAKLVKSTARILKLSPSELAEAAARLNRPFATSHVR